MNETTIKKLIGEATKKILEGLNNTKKELKRDLDATETNLLMKIEDHNKILKALQKEKKDIKQRLELSYERSIS